jgi:phage terminase large subunit-like protein
VRYTLQMAAPMAPVKLVVASRGKAVRAEPVSVLYDPAHDLVRHVGYFPELEEQMLSFSSAGYQGARSPNRVDALVWALTELLVSGGTGLTDFL